MCEKNVKLWTVISLDLIDHVGQGGGRRSTRLMTPSYEEMPSGEFCVQRDIGAKDFGDRTVLLGVFC